MLCNNYLRGIRGEKTNTDQWKIRVTLVFVAIINVSGDPIGIKEKNMEFWSPPHPPS